MLAGLFRLEDFAGLFEVGAVRGFGERRPEADVAAHFLAFEVLHRLVDDQHATIRPHAGGGIGDAEGIEGFLVIGDVHDRLVEALPWPCRIFGDGDTDPLVIAVHRIAFAIAIVAHVVKVVFAVVEKRVGIVGDVGVPVFRPGGGIDAARRQCDIDVSIGTGGFVRNGVGDFRMNGPAGGEPDFDRPPRIEEMVFPVRAFDRSPAPNKVAGLAETIGGGQRLDAGAEVEILSAENGG